MKKIRVWICSCTLLICLHVCALQCASFFDFSEESALLERFRVFEEKHDIEFSQLQNFHVFDSQDLSKVSRQAAETAKSLIRSLSFYSGSIDDNESKKIRQLYGEYKLFYREYYKKHQINEISEDMLSYMRIFSTLYELIRLYP